MTRLTALLGLVATLAAGPAFAAPALVHLAPDAQAKFGLRTQALAAGSFSPSATAYAKVIDAGPLAALENEIEAAEAAAAASRAEAARTKALNADDAAVALKVAEAAQAQARADAARVTLARRRLGLEWGPAIARLSDRNRVALINSLAAGRAALVRIDTPSNAGQGGVRTAMLEIAPDQPPVRAVVLGPARTAEARLISSGLLAEVAGPAAASLSVGFTARARLEAGSARTGVILPREALIRSDGGTWAYVRKGPDSFERRAVESPAPADGGLFVAKGFAPGEQVVTTGAGAVFAAEHAPAAEAD
jgi:hypothetical protein